MGLERIKSMPLYIKLMLFVILAFVLQVLGYVTPEWESVEHRGNSLEYHQGLLVQVFSIWYKKECYNGTGCDTISREGTIGELCLENNAIFVIQYGPYGNGVTY